ncbi:MAG: YidB family protein [Acidobacteriota bacterium]|nr:YidB family protein [Acidobacteriota bacterium]
MFDSMISEAGEKFNLGDKAGTVLSALLALITNKNSGGFAGFLAKFNAAGLGDTAASWIGSGSNMPISNEQTESALGAETLRNMADQAGTSYDATTSAAAYMTPRVVDALTPEGVVPPDGDLLSRIGGYLTGIGGATLGGIGTAAALTGGSPDKADAAVGERINGTLNSGGDRLGDGNGDDGGGSALKWLIPLLLLGLLIVLGYMFCGKSTPVATNTANANANVTANANVKPNANQAVVINNNAAVTPNDNAAATVGERKLTEVSLPDGTKLQAYPGGIEDQLIKFIESDEYKKGTADSLKDKWFSFDDLNFEFGTTELVPESKRQLDNIVAILKAFPAAKIKIGGYTDKKGDDAANKKLSDSRAKAVQSALGKAGVGAQVPEAEGYGEEFAKIPETAGDKEREADRKTSVRLLK